MAPRRAIIRPAPQEHRQTQRQGPWIQERLFSTNVKHVSQLTCQECGSCFKIHSLRQLHEQPKERISIEPAFWYIPYRWTVCIRTGKEPSPWPQTKSSGLLQKEMKEIKQLFQICLCFPWGFVKCSGGRFSGQSLDELLDQDGSQGNRISTMTSAETLRLGGCPWSACV